MAQLQDTDRYDPDRDPFKVCCYCGNPVSQSLHSLEVGKCARHSEIFSEDIASGWKQNRLKSLIDAYEANNI